MEELFSALDARIDAVEEATETFRDAVLDYHALADTGTGTETQLDGEADRVVDVWLDVERERKQLDAVVRDVGATFRVRVTDAEGQAEETTVTPGTLSGFLQATYSSARNVTDIDPHPRYTEEDAATLLAALDENYVALAAADRTYIRSLDLLAPYSPIITEKRERATRETGLDDPYRELDRVLARRSETAEHG